MTAKSSKSLSGMTIDEAVTLVSEDPIAAKNTIVLLYEALAAEKAARIEFETRWLSLHGELWEGVQLHGLKAPVVGKGSDGERLILAYCSGIVAARAERDAEKAARDSAERERSKAEASRLVLEMALEGEKAAREAAEARATMAEHQRACIETTLAAMSDGLAKSEAREAVKHEALKRIHAKVFGDESPETAPLGNRLQVIAAIADTALSSSPLPAHVQAEREVVEAAGDLLLAYHEYETDRGVTAARPGQARDRLKVAYGRLIEARGK
jgi:hypothetical protein